MKKEIKKYESYKANSHKLNKYYTGKFEYHICMELDPENEKTFDDKVILRSANDNTYFESLSIHDEKNTEKTNINGIHFLVVKFKNVKPKRSYTCYIDRGINMHDHSESEQGVWFIFQDFYIDFEELSLEGDPDIEEAD